MTWLKNLIAKLPPAIQEYGVRVVFWLVLMAAGGLLTWLGLPTPKPEPFPVPIFIDGQSGEHGRPVAVIVPDPTNRADPEVFGQADVLLRERGNEVYHSGWVRDPEAVKAFASTLNIPVFADTPAGKIAADELPKSVYLWQAYQQLFARPPPCKDQNPVGSCVSFGTNTAIERTMAAEIAILKRNFEFKHIAEEVTYAGSRVEIGGNRIRGDGSNGSWAARFVKEYGVVPREKVGNYDLSRYDPVRCRQWGSRGVPDDLEPAAREHPVQDVSQIKSWAEAKKALAQGYGIAICSGRGFSMQRNAKGICEPRGSWAHCMALDGYHIDADGKEYGHIENSWGPDAHTGPVGWGEPTTAGFWVRAEVIDKDMIRDGGDTWAFAAVKGFPSRKKVIDWFAHHRQQGPRERDRLLAFLAW